MTSNPADVTQTIEREAAESAIAEIRNNAEALKKLFNSVTDQQQQATGFMGGGYGIEQQARDALECAFRLASSSVHAMNKTADALDAVANVSRQNLQEQSNDRT